MASPSGASGSCLLHESGSQDMEAVMAQKKRKRMISNRESARRSRMRKQKQLADLMAEANQLRKENNQVFTLLKITTQQFSSLDAENSVLRAQVMELNRSLKSLIEILHKLRGNRVMDDFISPWNFRCTTHPIVTSAENMFEY